MAAKKQVKKLYLSKKDKVLTGLIGGLGEFFEVDSTLLRIVIVIAAAMSGFVPLIVAYFIAAFLVSQQS